MDAAAEIGNLVRKHQIHFSLSINRVWRIRRLTRDGTVEPVSRDKILRRERKWIGNVHFGISLFG